jgi:hypothetical protein
MTTPKDGVDACPAGWQLVPVEPTDEMRRAGVDAYNAHTSAMFFYVWKAMLAAAAQPPGVEVDEDGKRLCPACNVWVKPDTLCLPEYQRPDCINAGVAPTPTPMLDAMERAKAALPEFRQQDDYLLAHGASLMSDSSHEIIHTDTLTRIVLAVLAHSTALVATSDDDTHARAVASWKKAASNMIAHWKTNGPTVEAQWCTHAAQLLSMGGELMPGVEVPPAPLLYLSEKQLPLLGKAYYIAYRLKPEGNFQLPLYAHEAGVAPCHELSDADITRIWHEQGLGHPTTVPDHETVAFARAIAAHLAAAGVGEGQTEQEKNHG